MKKIVSLFLCFAVLLSFAVLAETEAPAMAMTDIVVGETTVGDIKAASLEIQAFMYDSEGELIIGFTFSDGPALLTAQGTDEQIAMLDELLGAKIEVEEIEAHKAKEDELYDAFVITSVEDLSDGVISDEELSALVGGTVQELLDGGFTEDQYWFNEETGEIVFELVADEFYRYIFLADCDAETFEAQYGEEEMYALTVKSARFDGITQDAAGSVDFGDVFGMMDDVMSNESFLDIIKEGHANGTVGDEDLAGLLDYLMAMLPEDTDLGDIKDLKPMELIERIMEKIPKDFDVFGDAESVEED